jgi:hypothetical protein
MIEIRLRPETVKAACKKSRAIVDECLQLLSNGRYQELSSRVARVRSLFLVAHMRIPGYSYEYFGAEEERIREWGGKDIMVSLDAGDEKECLRLAANFSGGAVHFLTANYRFLWSVWMEALSEAAARDAAPAALHFAPEIPRSLFAADAYKYPDADGLRVVQRCCKGLQHLSLPLRSRQCVEALSGFSSLATLDISFDYITELIQLSEFHPDRSPIAGSVRRLCCSFPGWSERNRPRLREALRGFLQWTHLQEIDIQILQHITEEDVIGCMEELVQSSKIKSIKKKEADAGAAAPVLYSFSLHGLGNEIAWSQKTVAAVVDALSLIGLPFLQVGVAEAGAGRRALADPSIEAQLRRNQRQFMLGFFDLQRAPATSMRLFVCGDPFAGTSSYSTRTAPATLYSTIVDHA